MCGICMESEEELEDDVTMVALWCGHRFCSECWSQVCFIVLMIERILNDLLL